MSGVVGNATVAKPAEDGYGRSMASMTARNALNSNRNDNAANNRVRAMRGRSQA